MKIKDFPETWESCIDPLTDEADTRALCQGPEFPKGLHCYQQNAKRVLLVAERELKVEVPDYGNKDEHGARLARPGFIKELKPGDVLAKGNDIKSTPEFTDSRQLIERYVCCAKASALSDAFVEAARLRHLPEEAWSGARGPRCKKQDVITLQRLRELARSDNEAEVAEAGFKRFQLRSCAQKWFDDGDGGQFPFRPFDQKKPITQADEGEDVWLKPLQVDGPFKDPNEKLKLERINTTISVKVSGPSAPGGFWMSSEKPQKRAPDEGKILWG